MANFVVLLSEPANQKFRDLIDHWYPKHYEYLDTAFFLQDDNIPDIIARRLGVKSEETSLAPGVVLELEGAYAGFTRRALWDWFKLAEKRDDQA